MKKYDSYKDSGVEWIGEIPSHWSKIKLSMTINTTQGIQVDVPKQRYVKEEGYERFLRISDYTNPNIEHRFVNVPNLINYMVNEDDIVMFRYGESGKVVKGLKGVICNNVFSISSKKHEMSNNYLFEVFSSNDFYELLKSSSNNPTLSQVSHSQIKEQKVPFPPLSEQQEIVSFLDTKTSLIDSLIEKTQRKIELLKEKRQKLIEEVILNGEIERVRLKHVVDLIKRPINREDNETYNKIGMYNWGRGIFKYPTEKGSELGDSTFNFIKEGDLLLSGQFSWEGSVSMVGKEVHNCISSHRFHILMGRKDIVLNEYLWSYFTSQEGHFLLTENSFGSSGRNQPLNIRRLLKEKIPIPELSFQLKIKELVDYTRRFEKHSKRNIELLKEYRQSLISEVVTGKRKVV